MFVSIGLHVTVSLMVSCIVSCAIRVTAALADRFQLRCSKPLHAKENREKSRCRDRFLVASNPEPGVVRPPESCAQRDPGQLTKGCPEASIPQFKFRGETRSRHDSLRVGGGQGEHFQCDSSSLFWPSRHRSCVWVCLRDMPALTVVTAVRVAIKRVDGCENARSSPRAGLR